MSDYNPYDPQTDARAGSFNVLATGWENVRAFVLSWGPRRTDSMTNSRYVLASLRHGNGAWL